MDYYAVVKNILWQYKIDTGVSIGANMKIYSTLSAVGFMVTTLIHTTHPIAAESRGEADGCPANSSWISKERSCYLYLRENVNITQAKGGCEGLGAHLVSIGSEEENQFIVDFVGATNLPVWIGLFRTTTESCAGDSCVGWMWVDGSDQGYSRWPSGSAANSIQCVFMDSQGDWDHGRLCSAPRGYVCEQKRIFPDTTPDSTTTEFLDSYSSGMGDVDSTTDATMKNDDQPSTYVIIGVVAVIVTVATFLGVLVYFIKTRRRNEREKRESGAISHTRGVSTGSRVYENYGSEAFRGPTGGHDQVRVNSVHLDTDTREDSDMRTIRHIEDAGDCSAYEDNQAYDKVNKYSEINPEYTQLKSVNATDNSETTQGDINVVYANVQQ